MQTIFYALAGGCVLVMAMLIEVGIGDKSKRPDFKDWYVWLRFVGYPLIGAFFAHIYGLSNVLSPFQSAYIGLSVPSIVKAAVSGNLSALNLTGTKTQN